MTLNIKIISLITLAALLTTALFPLAQVAAVEDVHVESSPAEEKATITPILYGIWAAEVGDEYTDIHLWYEIIQDTNYTYDPVGNITKLDDDSETDANRNIVYGYDDLNRLTSATSTSTPAFTHSYSYNAIGNIASSTPAGTYTYAGTSYANPHAATSINGNTQTYDNNGNLLSDSTWNFAWDYQNRLTQTGSANATSTFAYDHSGSRVLMNNGQTTRVYANKYFNTDSETHTKHIFAGDLLIATIQGSGATSTIQYIHTDHLTGSSSATDDTGGVVQLLDYYPYGELRIDDSYSTFDEQRKFTGHEYDRSTGLNYMGARYHNPATARFISQDPIFLLTGASNFSSGWNKNWRDVKPEQFKNSHYSQFSQQFGKEENEQRLALLEYLSDPQGLNSYSYVKNNPLKYTDPNGEFAFLLAIPVAEFVIPIAVAGVATIGAIAYNKFAKERPLQWDPGRFQLPRIHNQQPADEMNLSPNGPPKNLWGKILIGTAGASAIVQIVKETYKGVKHAFEFLQQKISSQENDKNQTKRSSEEKIIK